MHIQMQLLLMSIYIYDVHTIYILYAYISLQTTTLYSLSLSPLPSQGVQQS